MIRVSNSLDSDQAQHVVGPDLGPNCLQRLSADKSPLPGKELIFLLPAETEIKMSSAGVVCSNFHFKF